MLPSAIAPLSADDRQFFADHGWLVVRGVVPPAQVAAVEAALDAVVPTGSYIAWGDSMVEVAGISRAAAAIAALVHDPAIAALAGVVLDAERIQLLQDTALIKPAGGAAEVAWHQDHSYLTYLDRPAVVTARVALTPCTVASGCMRVLDGSHQWGLHGDDLAFKRASVEDTRGALPAALRERAEGCEQVLELAPGDVSLHGCLTFHGSQRNTSAATRKTIAVRFMDGACKLVAERLPSPELRAMFTTDDDGHLTGDWFPTVWRRG